MLFRSRMRRTPFEEATLGTSKFQQVLDHAKQMEAQAKQKNPRKGKEQTHSMEKSPGAVSPKAA